MTLIGIKLVSIAEIYSYLINVHQCKSVVVAPVFSIAEVYSAARLRRIRYTSEISPRKTKNAGIDHCKPSTKKVVTDIPRSRMILAIVKNGCAGRRIGKLRS